MSPYQRKRESPDRMRPEGLRRSDRTSRPQSQFCRYTRAVTAGQRKPASHRTPIAANGNCATPTTALLLHARPSRFWAGTALQNFWCARRDSNPHDFTHCHLKAARLPIPPRALKGDRHGIGAGPDHRRRCNKSGMGGQGLPTGCFKDRQGSDNGRGFSGCPAISAAFA